MNFLRQSVHALCQAVQHFLRRWTKPSNDALVSNAAVDLTRSKTELVLENALLRQQLIVLKRQAKRPALSWRDRGAVCPPGQQVAHLETGAADRETRYPPALAS